MVHVGNTPEPDRHASGDAGAVTESGLARELGGDLVCARCGYSLRGLSIRTACPECGLPVLTTILSIVDPRASELQPIRYRRIVAAGLMIWTGGALVGALLTWILRGRDVLVLMGIDLARPEWAAVAGLGCFIASGAGALALIRPHRGVARREAALAGVGVALYVPLAWAYWRINLSLDAAEPGLAMDLEAPSMHRVFLRMTTCLVGALILVSLRPRARALAARSVVVRTGRVDRQSMQVIALVLLIGAAGDALTLVTADVHGTTREVIVAMDALVVAATSVLVTLGLIGMVRDSLRVVPAILTPPLSPRQMLGGGESSGPSGRLELDTSGG